MQENKSNILLGMSASQKLKITKSKEKFLEGDTLKIEF
tara:strand:+ start:353 stop:466 length:114 start_codon:yes stop_codon:yes gene_type:complete